MTFEIKEDDIVLCTVKKIGRTTVFVDIENNGEGSIVMSEVAAGRIRNIRDYVVPNKKIVCKVLKIVKGHAQLSLRRVTAKEREEVLERHKKERTLKSMLKTILKEPEKIIEKIKHEHEISDFIEEARENPKILDKFLNKTEAERLSKLLEEKKEKAKTVKKTLILKSTSPTGLEDIKSILETKEAKISYLGSSKFSISTSGKDFKEANSKMDSAIEEIEKKAKSKHAQLEIKEKKK
jgi:translation initiation factor 2 alpha subunit (eIF-2alpha)